MINRPQLWPARGTQPRTHTRLRSGALLGAIAVLAVLAATAQNAEARSAGPEAHAAATGTIIWAKNGEATGLDPQVNGQLVSWDVLFRVYEPLVRLNAKGAVVPNLALRWRQPSPTTYIFDLRSGVKFSNGRTLTGDDVVGSFARVLDPKLGSYALSRLGMIRQIKKLKGSRVQFTLKHADGTFLPALTGLAAAVLPMKELKAGSYDPAKQLLGTGPYKVAQHLANESWSLEQNPFYWRKGVPKAAKLNLLVMNDSSARMAALRSGRADVATFDDPDTPKLLAGSSNIKVVRQTSSDFYVLDLNALTPNAPKLKDARVRQAIAHAIDRAQLIDLALGGSGRPVVGAGTVDGLPDSCNAARLPRHDVQKARQLLAAAGASDLSLTMEVNTASPVIRNIAQVLQSQLQAAGIKVALESLEQGAWLDKVYGKGQFDANVSFYTAFVDNSFGLRNWSPSSVGFTKVFSVDDAAFNKLLAQSAPMAPGKKRASVFQKMCERAAALSNIVPLATRTSFVAYRTDRVVASIPSFEPGGNAVQNIAEFTQK